MDGGWSCYLADASAAGDPAGLLLLLLLLLLFPDVSLVAS